MKTLLSIAMVALSVTAASADGTERPHSARELTREAQLVADVVSVSAACAPREENESGGGYEVTFRITRRVKGTWSSREIVVRDVSPMIGWRGRLYLVAAADDGWRPVEWDAARASGHPKLTAPPPCLR